MDNRISSLRFSVVSLFPMEQDLVVDAVEENSNGQNFCNQH